VRRSAHRQRRIPRVCRRAAADTCEEMIREDTFEELFRSEPKTVAQPISRRRRKKDCIRSTDDFFHRISISIPFFAVSQTLSIHQGDQIGRIFRPTGVCLYWVVFSKKYPNFSPATDMHKFQQKWGWATYILCVFLQTIRSPWSTFSCILVHPEQSKLSPRFRAFIFPSWRFYFGHFCCI
jgi:hypothetical protein